MPSSPSSSSSPSEPELAAVEAELAAVEPELAAVEAELGPLRIVARLGGRVWRLAGAAGHLVVKTGASAVEEAQGLRRLAAVQDGPRVPAVRYVADGMVVIDWVEPGPATPEQEEQLGAALARMHATPAPDWGGGSSWIGACRVDPSSAPTAAAFYGRRLLDLARRCGLEGAVAPVVARFEDLVPPSAPAVLHGDLWWGNVVWGGDRCAWLIDPSFHHGHPEEDLAMLALFGSVPERLFAAYRSVRLLESGWESRVALWQLYPLLVHTVLFGGSYRRQAEAAAHKYRA